MKNFAIHLNNNIKFCLKENLSVVTINIKIICNVVEAMITFNPTTIISNLKFQNMIFCDVIKILGNLKANQTFRVVRFTKLSVPN